MKPGDLVTAGMNASVWIHAPDMTRCFIGHKQRRGPLLVLSSRQSVEYAKVDNRGRFNHRLVTRVDHCWLVLAGGRPAWLTDVCDSLGRKHFERIDT